MKFIITGRELTLGKLELITPLVCFRELKLKALIIENFISPEEKRKILSRAYFDEDEDIWKVSLHRAPVMLFLLLSNLQFKLSPTSVI